MWLLICTIPSKDHATHYFSMGKGGLRKAYLRLRFIGVDDYGWVEFIFIQGMAVCSLWSNGEPYNCECRGELITFCGTLNKRRGHEFGRGTWNISGMEVKLWKQLEGEILKEWEKYITNRYLNIQWNVHNFVSIRLKCYV